MKKIKILGFLAIFGMLITVPTLLIMKFLPSDVHYKTVKVSGSAVRAEVADTTPKRIEGLMSKKVLPEDEGMLFIFNSEGHHGIWMMNMSFSIDILWIDENLRVVDIAESAQPCKFNCPVYLPDEKSLYVLEVSSGFIKENNIQLGDSVSIS